MKRWNTRLLAAVFAISCSGITWAQESWFDITDEARPAEKNEQSPEFSYQIKLNTEAIKIEKKIELMLELPDGKYIAILTPVDNKLSGIDASQYSWNGIIIDPNSGDSKNVLGEVYFMRTKGYYQARLVIGKKSYSLRTRANGIGVLEQYDNNQLIDHPEGVNPPVARPSPDIGALPDESCLDTPDRIDLMVLYTEEAKMAASIAIGEPASSAGAIENEIAFAVGQANLVLDNSAAFHRYNLVRVDEVNYDESTEGGASVELLNELASSSDQVMDEIHGWRDSSKADLVSLVSAGGDCGWGYAVELANATGTDNNGFSVVNRSCMNTNLSLAHETGHNMGALHNIENSGPSSLSPAFNYGSYTISPSNPSEQAWRTVMSYNSDACVAATAFGCSRITQFSNPNISYPTVLGDPTGEVDSKDNVRVFSQNDNAVAQYRCVANGQDSAYVWGKDTWADTGLEPDPATAQQAMWRSPYIWMRNARDEFGTHYHEHENPGVGGSPYVYVKLNNDGNLPESGVLELYYASASTNLNDSSNWTLISSQSQTVQSGVNVFEFQWSTLPGEGHFCLLARWNTDGSVMSFTNSDEFVRYNKAVMWRNVNIIPSPDGGEEKQILTLRGTKESVATFLEIKAKPFTERPFPWEKLMTVSLSLDKRILSKQMQLIGARQSAPGKFSLDMSSERIVIGPVYLEDQQESKASLLVSMDKKNLPPAIKQFGPNRRYSISIQQLLPQALFLKPSDKPQRFASRLVLGGVDYIVELQKQYK